MTFMSHTPHDPRHAHAAPPAWITLTPVPTARFAGVCGDLSRTPSSAPPTWGEFAVMLNSDVSLSTQNTLNAARRTGAPGSPERHAALNAALQEGRRHDATFSLFCLREEKDCERRLPNPGDVMSGPVFFRRLADGRLQATLTHMLPWNLPAATFEGPDLADIRAQVQAHFTQLGLLDTPEGA